MTAGIGEDVAVMQVGEPLVEVVGAVGGPVVPWLEAVLAASASRAWKQKAMSPKRRRFSDADSPGRPRPPEGRGFPVDRRAAGRPRGRDQHQAGTAWAHRRRAVRDELLCYRHHAARRSGYPSGDRQDCREFSSVFLTERGLPRSCALPRSYPE